MKDLKTNNWKLLFWQTIGSYVICWIILKEGTYVFVFGMIAHL